jgi:hypothetical protein
MLRPYEATKHNFESCPLQLASANTEATAYFGKALRTLL